MIENYLEKTFYIDKDQEITLDLLKEFIDKHGILKNRYAELYNMYTGFHNILYLEKKPDFKPDNRLVFNYAKYIVDTFNGFFIGIPVKITHSDERVSEVLNFFDAYNNTEDMTAEISKLCSIYGHAYELLYLDENTQVGACLIDPMECFLIRDNSITEDTLYGIRYQMVDDKISGSISDSNSIKYFESNDEGKLIFISEEPNYFGRVPIVEYVENEERQGAFESVETLINAYNKAMSEKANDVDYFADSYMKILGARLDKENLQEIKANRIINLAGGQADKVEVAFMEKPNADETQEHLINRLERQIFALSMVANITDENFGTSSGIALKYKLLSMSNLAITKERKFQRGFSERYRILAGVPTSKINQDDIAGIEYKFTRNTPSNILEETQIGLNLKSLVSDETILNNLSVVQDVKSEMERLEEENKPMVTYDDKRLEDE